MDTPIYVIVTNDSNVVVGKDVYAGDSTTGLSQRQAQYPAFTFTTVDAQTFSQAAFVGPSYLGN